METTNDIRKTLQDRVDRLNKLLAYYNRMLAKLDQQEHERVNTDDELQRVQ